MKKLINRPEAVVREMLEGMVTLSPGKVLLADEMVATSVRRRRGASPSCQAAAAATRPRTRATWARAC